MKQMNLNVYSAGVLTTERLSLKQAGVALISTAIIVEAGQLVPVYMKGNCKRADRQAISFLKSRDLDVHTSLLLMSDWLEFLLYLYSKDFKCVFSPQLHYMPLQ